MTKLKTNNEY